MAEHWCLLWFYQLEESANSPEYSDISRRDSIFELASLTARAAGVICDAPVLNFLKPIVDIAVIICDTAKVNTYCMSPEPFLIHKARP
jgi:hypothetical protein